MNTYAWYKDRLTMRLSTHTYLGNQERKTQSKKICPEMRKKRTIKSDNKYKDETIYNREWV